MRLLHFSDLHGRHFKEAASLIEARQPDWIVLSGDILPDFYMLGGRLARLEAQREFWLTYRSRFLLEGRPTLFVRGNHEQEGFKAEPGDLRSPPELLGKVGLLEGIPAEWGAWGFAREWEEDQLQAEVDRLTTPRVIVSHVPPYGHLDQAYGGQHIGHPPLGRYLDETPEPPHLVLCGHVHQAFGQKRLGPTLVVNAATGYADLSYDPHTGVAEVREMASFGGG